MTNEENISTKQAEEKKLPRIQSKNGNCRGQTSDQCASQKRAQTSLCIANKLGKSARLRSRYDFARLRRSGKKFRGYIVSIEYNFGKSREPRLGITTSKKYGKAHERNRFKRVSREAFRKIRQELPPNVEMNIRPRLGEKYEVSLANMMCDFKRFAHSLGARYEASQS